MQTRPVGCQAFRTLTLARQRERGGPLPGLLCWLWCVASALTRVPRTPMLTSTLQRRRVAIADAGARGLYPLNRDRA